MTVRRRILVLQFTCLLFIVAMIGVTAIALRVTDRFVQRIDAVHRRFEVIAELVGYTNNYGEQVAEVLLLGRDQLRDLDDARIDMERAFARLSQVTRAAFATVGAVEVDAELRELETTRRMVELYHAIDMSASRALTLQRDGQRVMANETFQREVEFRLANELEPLLVTSLQGERDEVARQLDEIDRLQNELLIASGAIALLALLAAAGLGVLLHRAIMRPVRKLAAAAEAVSAGNLDQRIAPAGNDELAALSRTFDGMAQALKDQRDGLVRARDKLASEIDARTGELSAANERLRDIDSRRAQFLADVSHELRTPLTILRGEAEVALRGPGTSGEQRQSLELIRGQAADLGKLLDELLAFARSDAEAQDYVTAETRLDRLISAALQEGGVLAETREIRLTMDLKDQGAVVDADFRRLKQALIIGLDNAVKHSPPGGRIEVATAPANGRATITISDEGPGIAPGEETRVFERFYRGSSEDDQGLGIGLAIAKGIVERHGGTIALSNRPGGGAVLEISLPLTTGGAP